MMNNQESNIKTIIILISIFSIIFFFSFANADSMLEKGSVVYAKMRSLVTNSDTGFWDKSSDIKAIRMAESLPESFIPSEANIVSAADSIDPIYVFFDNQDNAGIIYFYTEGNRIIMNPDSSFMFSNNTALVDISGLTNWDASHVLSLNGMFMYDSSLSSLSALSNWDVHNVTGMLQTFMHNTSLCDISALAAWDTSNVINMYGLFGGATSLKDALALRNWDTSNVTDMSHMFSGAIALEYIDVSTWNTGNVTAMDGMFQVGENQAGNGQLREIVGLGNWDVSNVTDMTCMFYGAGQMTYYDISNWNVSKVESMNHMFCDNYSLRMLDLSGWDVSSVKTLYCMFDDNKSLKTIGDVSRWNTKSLIDAGGWLNGCTSFIGDNYGALDLSGWNTNKLKAAGEMFRATKLHTIDLSGWTFDSITNETWENAGKGIYYETSNGFERYMGLGEMFKDTTELDAVYVSQFGMESFNSVVEAGVHTLNMWSGSKSSGFTVK